MESKSREQFHAWLKSQGINPPYSVKSGYWKIWQASRAALVVGLPPDLQCEGLSTSAMCNWARNQMKDHICAVLVAAGITVKGEGDEKANI